MRTWISLLFIIIGIIFYILSSPPPITTYSKQEVPFKDTSFKNSIAITSRDPADANAEIDEVIATIRCDEINLYTTASYGATQSQVDRNDVCLTFGNRFDGAYAILNGHGYKSFNKLNDIKIDNEIFIHAYYGDFKYKVTDVIYGYTDRINIYNSSNIPQINTNPSVDTLYLYTCYGWYTDSRLLIHTKFMSNQSLS